MEFSKDLVKVSCEARLYKSHFLSCDSAANTFTLQPHDGNPRAGFPHIATFLGLKPFLESHYFFPALYTFQTHSYLFIHNVLPLSPHPHPYPTLAKHTQYSISTDIFGTSGCTLP